MEKIVYNGKEYNFFKTSYSHMGWKPFGSHLLKNILIQKTLKCFKMSKNDSKSERAMKDSDLWQLTCYGPGIKNIGF